MVKPCPPLSHVKYFIDQTPRLLLISLFVLCGYYSRVATIKGLDAVRSMRTLSVLLSAVETTHTTQTVLALAWWLSSEIIRTCRHVLRLLPAAAVWGRRLFHSRASDCVATIRGWRLFKEIWYIPSIVEMTVSLCPQNLHTWEPGNETTSSINLVPRILNLGMRPPLASASSPGSSYEGIWAKTMAKVGKHEEVLGSSGAVPQVHEQAMCIIKLCRLSNYVHYQPTITIIKENYHTLHIWYTPD